MGSKLEDIVVFDLETSGVDVYEDRIVTAFIGVMQPDGTLIEKHSWVIDPGVSIPEGATAVHGITNEFVKDNGIPAAEGVREIVDTIARLSDQGLPITGFNLQYDLTLLYYEALRYNVAPVIPNIVYDGYVLDKQIDPYRKGKRTLTAQAAYYGIPVTNAHDAEADCIVAGQLMFKILASPKLGNWSPAGLHKAQVGWKAEQSASLEAYFRRTDANATVDGRWPIRYKTEEEK